MTNPAQTSRPQGVPAEGKTPPGLGRDLALARAHGAWMRAVQTGDLAGGLAALSDIPPSTQDIDDSRLTDMRLWAAQTHLRQGRPAQAKTWLDQAEGDGQTCETRLLRARLAYFRNDFDACTDACAEAMVLSADAGQAAAVRALWAEALGLMGEAERAWALLRQGMTHGAQPTSDDMRALRQTVTDNVQLERFCGLLADSFHAPGASGRAALYHYSMACRDLGLHDRAIAAIRRRFTAGVVGETWGGRRSPPKDAAWTEDASAALRDLKTVMDGAGAPFFLISGTLLGCVREGGVLAHDKDIDVGVMEQDGLNREPIHRALASSGVFLLKPYHTAPALLRLKHASGVLIDVFWHRMEDGRVIHEGARSKWWNTAFDLVETDFLGQRHLIPDDHARYLGENYGDWEKPDPDFETFVDTPNMVVTSPPQMSWYYYCKLFDYYALGKAAQFRKVFGQVTRLHPEDREVRRIGYRVLELIGD